MPAHELYTGRKREAVRTGVDPDGYLLHEPGEVRIRVTCTCGMDTGWTEREPARDAALRHADEHGIPVAAELRQNDTPHK